MYYLFRGNENMIARFTKGTRSRPQWWKRKKYFLWTGFLTTPGNNVVSHEGSFELAIETVTIFVSLMFGAAKT